MTYWAKVTLQFEGLHHYPNAPEAVKFLRDPHRHIFHVTVWIEQFHDNRDLEYFLTREWLSRQVTPMPMEDSDSCEAMASHLANAARLEFPGRGVKVEVLEDKENGAFVELDSTTQTDAAYLAGVIDSDGSICAVTGNQSLGRITVQVAMINLAVPSWIHKHFGGREPAAVPALNARAGVMFNWTVSGAACEPVLRAVKPYLVLKSRQAEIGLAICATAKPKGSGAFSSKEVLIREKLTLLLREANRK